MKTITDVYNVYTFEELNEDAKQEVREWYLRDEMRGEMLTEDFENSFIEYFFPNSDLKIQWSLSSCQGDGVNMYGNVLLMDIINYIKNWNDEEHANFKHHNPQGVFTDKELRRLSYYIQHDNNSVTVANIKYNNHYSYCMASSIDFAEDLYEDLAYWNVRDIDRDLIEKFQDLVISIMERLCREMERYGYAYLYEVEDETIIDACESNGWMFYETGVFYGGVSE